MIGVKDPSGQMKVISGGSVVTQNDINETVDFHNESIDAHDDIRTEILDEVNIRTQAIIELSNTIDSLDIEMEAADTALENKIIQAESDLQQQIDGIEELLPNQASFTNQLADKNFVNSSISNMASNYVTPNAAGDEQFASLDALRAGIWYHGGAPYSPSQNDYAIFINTDNSIWRASFNGNLWSPTYKINDSPFTAAQLATINSGITSELVQKILNNESSISLLQTALNLTARINIANTFSELQTFALLDVNGLANFNNVNFRAIVNFMSNITQNNNIKWTIPSGNNLTFEGDIRVPTINL